MIGQIIYSAVHRGEVFTENGRTFALLNGQALSRTTYPDLSTLWPSGSFGGGDVDTPMHLPDTAGLYLRGVDLGRLSDAQAASRTALSGSRPVGDTPGSYQAAVLKTHAHVSGTAIGQSFEAMEGGGESTRTFPGATAVTTTSTKLANTARPVSITAGGFDVDHMKVYMYISIGTAP